MNKKIIAGILAAAGVGIAFYQFSKMSEEDKDTLVANLKAKATDLYNEYAPPELKDLFAKKAEQPFEPEA